MKIALIYNKESLATTGAYLEKVIKDSGINYKHFWTKDAYTIPHEFDLYFRIDHGDYKYDLPQFLKPSIFYVIDTHLKKPYKKIRCQVKNYDIIFCAQKDGCNRLYKDTKLDIHWVPLGCDKDIHKKQDILKKYDIAFVGRDAKKFARGRHLELLKAKYPNSFIDTADYTLLGSLYSSAKIGFNSSIYNDINMRVFEVMASGSMLITNHIKNNGFFELFTQGQHLVTYKNDKEMLELIEYYLTHDKERETIAACGYEHVINNHTYFHRVQTMFNYIAFKFGGKFNQLRI